MNHLMIPLLFLAAIKVAAADDLAENFATPPDAARPGVYWFFMDGNLSREGITHDLESMRAAGIGHALMLEADVGMPRGPVDFMNDQWQDLIAHAMHEADRLGIQIMLGTGPGWTGSGGPWVNPAQSMQHLVAGKVEVQGPAAFSNKLPVPPPRKPYFGPAPVQLHQAWTDYFKDVAVLAFPTPATRADIADIDEKALYYRAPMMDSAARPRFDAPADYPPAQSNSEIPRERIIDLTKNLKPDGTLDWQVPAGAWTILRFVSRNNGSTTKPAPVPGIGFECDKFDAAALKAHFDAYIGKLRQKVGPPTKDRGWTMVHIDSWEMGVQNWTAALRAEFTRRRGYDPQPFYPAYLGYVVTSREITERFLWDLRQTAGELLLENHVEALKALGRQQGLGLSIEPYDQTPYGDFDYGAVADVPMGEFWSDLFNTSYSIHEVTSIAHVTGRPVVAAEAFTAVADDWKRYPGSMKNLGDWAFAAGVNRFFYHTFAHKPDETRPGMTMGSYGVHWDRGQTWWSMAGTYHQYITRCQYLLRQGQAVADVLYLLPEGAPCVFQPPPSACTGPREMPDRRGYNFDGCSPRALIAGASVHDGRIVFPGGGAYRLLVLPNVETMTPELLDKLEALVNNGATVIGPAPRKSPSLVNHSACDRAVSDKANALWGALTPPDDQTKRACGKGALIWGGDASHKMDGLYPQYDVTAAVLDGMGVAQDFTSPGPLRYTHRSTGEREIYYVSNKEAAAVETTATFRISNRTPGLWDPVTGLIRPLPEFVCANGVTTVPLHFAPHQSFFVVFAAGQGTNADGRNFTARTAVSELAGPWTVAFDPDWGGPARAVFDKLDDWSARPEPGIRFYSGIATYTNTFALPPSAAGLPLWLDLGNVAVMASVTLNGKDLGVVWCPPWQLAVPRGLLRQQDNQIMIAVANLWPNRLIGDATSPDQAYTKTTHRPFKPGQPLLPSGLLGPVRIVAEERPNDK